MNKPLSFSSLVDALASVVDAQQDTRQQGKIDYSLSAAGLAAFSVFFMQSPSFLAYQRDNVPCETGMENRNTRKA